MKINHLTITIRPAFHSEYRDFKVEVETPGSVHTFQTTIAQNDFESAFQFLMKEAARCIQKEVGSLSFS